MVNSSGIYFTEAKAPPTTPARAFGKISVEFPWVEFTLTDYTLCFLINKTYIFDGAAIIVVDCPGEKSSIIARDHVTVIWVVEYNVH